ncbi:glycosyltransferase family 2 protein [Mucilaginibacter sp. AW1-7]|uniref:glycosyltransferase family 2 protein n=1 Tax=Mucilaginibacter sp. AW1-7 TaxID=3349874 RepID=UPI003F736055
MTQATFNPLKIKLPDLAAYRAAFVQKGVAYPLAASASRPEGLLQHLPIALEGKSGWPWTAEVSPAQYDQSIRWPKLTIVTPSYNQAGFIEETIRAVLLQNYPNLEYIVIDGGSTDGSAGIIKKYEPWLSYWQSQKDGGQGNAINLGFSLASGEYHAWINSDDYYLKGTFAKVARRFLSTRAQFVYGYSLDLDTASQQFKKPAKVLPFSDYFNRLPGLPQPSCFWAAAIHQPIWEELHCALDYELWLRLVKGRKRSRIKEPLSVANSHADAKTSDPKMKEKWLHDHELICSPEAHGPVPDWNKIVFINRLRLKLYRWLGLN